jgi:hypothetical protein
MSMAVSVPSGANALLLTCGNPCCFTPPVRFRDSRSGNHINRKCVNRLCQAAGPAVPGRRIRVLSVIDTCTREALAVVVDSS